MNYCSVSNGLMITYLKPDRRTNVIMKNMFLKYAKQENYQ